MNKAKRQPRVRSTGFSLIELMIVVAILSVLLGIGVPAFKAYLDNATLRTTAQTLISGLQIARSEAVRRNANVTFSLTTDAAPTNASVANALGRSWVITTTDPNDSTQTLLVESKVAAENKGSTIKINDADNDGAADAGSVSSIVFTGMGGTTLTGRATISLTYPEAGQCAPTGPMRCLNITISIGGQTRICDPAVTAGSDDTRACPI